MREKTSGPTASVMAEGSLVKKFNGAGSKTTFREVLVPALVILAIILAGGVSGYFLANKKTLGAGSSATKELVGGVKLVEGPKEVGIKDAKTFRDTAEGRIEANDALDNAEGSHRLIRPGGPSQTANLTSSVVDLNQFIGKCVQVWGETFAAQKAGWLMDIGRVKLLDQCPEGT